MSCQWRWLVMPHLPLGSCEDGIRKWWMIIIAHFIVVCGKVSLTHILHGSLFNFITLWIIFFFFFQSRDWGPEKYNNLLKVGKPGSRRCRASNPGSLAPQCALLATVACFKSVWKASGAWRALRLFWDPFEQVLEVVHNAVYPGLGHEWVESRNVRSGSRLVSAFARQSDTSDSLQTFQTTQDFAASQTVSPLVAL